MPEEDGLVPDGEALTDLDAVPEGDETRELAEMDGLLAVPDLDGLVPWLGEAEGLPVPDADVDFEREVPEGLAEDLEMLVPDEDSELLAVAEREDPVPLCEVWDGLPCAPETEEEAEWEVPVECEGVPDAEFEAFEWTVP